jgi:hypothetical protein
VARAVGLIAAYAVVTLVMTWPIFNVAAPASASYAGDARLMIWALAWDNHAVLSGLPLFDSNMFYPAPASLAFTEHSFGISLFTLPIYAATGNPVLAYNVIWFLSYVLCGLATHAWLRRYTGRDLAAFTGSLIFTFSFYKMLHGHGHLQQVWTWLLPLSLLMLERWADRPTWTRVFLWGAVTLLQALSSWYLAVMVVMANGALIAWRLASAGRAQVLSRLAQLAVVSLLAAVAIWPFAAPYRTLAPVEASQVQSLSADAAAYLMPAEQTWPGRAWHAVIGPGPRWMFGERTMSLGWIALALAAWGAAIAVRRRGWSVILPYGTLAIVALLLSFGPPAAPSGWSLYSLAAHIPGIDGFRTPARFGLLVLLGVSLMAALGADDLLARRRAFRLAAFVLIPVMLSEWFVIGFTANRPEPFAVPRIYRLPQIRSARALVSLPDYRSDPRWFFEADYLLFSTAHWRPIVNGYGRWEPPAHAHNMSYMMAFPGPNNAKEMRALGVEYVILHTARYADGAVDILRDAAASPEYDLVARMGADYLYKVK